MFYLGLIIAALLPASIAQSKGRNFAKWWLFSTIFLPITLILSILAKKQENYETVNNSTLKNQWVFVAFIIGTLSGQIFIQNHISKDENKNVVVASNS